MRSLQNSSSSTTGSLRAPTERAGALLVLGALLVALGATLVTGGCAALDLGDRTDETSGTAAGESHPAASESLSTFSPATVTGDGYDESATDARDAAAPLLRVGLASGLFEAAVSSDGPYTVKLFGETVREWDSGSAGRWSFRTQGDGFSGEGGSGAFPETRGTVRVSPAGGEDGRHASMLEFGNVKYRGEIEIFSTPAGSLSVANVVDVESYLRGVVPKEIGPRPVSEIEAVKAQAVAARTYAVASSGKRAGGSFDVWPTVADQVYGGADAETDVTDRAVLETAGVIAVYAGEPINAYFHANCGGRTEARQEVWELPGLPYLQSIWDTPGGSTRQGSAYCFAGAGFTWEESWDGAGIEGAVRDHLAETASTPVTGTVTAVRDIRVSARTPSGRVRWLEVETNLGKHRVFGDRVRWLLRRPGSGGVLRSAWFDLDVRKSGGRVSSVVARGRGYGHGVGMCQHGALEMAREGRSFKEILKHYYSGIELAEGYGESD